MEREELLAGISRPARYLGGEAGSVVKDPAKVKLHFALAFPEVYEIAMSHLGIKILYDMLAPRAEVAAERVFMPWIDLMELMERQGLAPWSLESGRPLDRFDVIGFSLQYELTYTNLLKMLELAGVPLRREDRDESHPLIIAGGPCAVNPEPIADFLDLCLVGDAEEVLHPLIDLFIEAKEQAWPRSQLYERAAGLPGVYAPSRFEPVYEDGRLLEVRALDPARPKVRRAVAPDLDQHPMPENPVVPTVKPVHDRLGVEVARGCTRGCRFCQAGYIYRPVRERSAENILQCARRGLANTGLEEMALLSLSTGDYTHIDELAAVLMDELEPKRVSLSLPSLRVDSLSAKLIGQIKRVRKTGFTLAPEAGSERMRRVINKNITEEQVLETAKKVFGLGWNLVKLYFMIGLPFESDEDLIAIGGLSGRVAQASGRKGGKKPLVHASIGIFVPKPHTPFQWSAQVDLEESKRRLALAKGSLNDRRVKAKWNSPKQSVLEGLLARGDRRLSRVLELAVAKGCRFDGWSEELNFQAWLDALEECGLSLKQYLRARERDEALPWDHIDAGVDKAYLLKELDKAVEGAATGDCRSGKCFKCGACDLKLVKPRLAQEPPQAGPAKAVSPAQQAEPFVYRYCLEKRGPARFWGHLEMITQLERAFRRAGVDLAYSQGFHPHAQLKTQSALPLGVESMAEVLEVKAHGEPDPQALADKVNRAMPQGLALGGGRLRRPGEGLKEPDLVTYQVRTQEPLDPGRLEWFEKQDELHYLRRTPKGERDLDMKRNIKELEVEDGGFSMVVGREGGRPKPFEVLEAVFGFSPEKALAARALKVAAAWQEDHSGLDASD